MSPNAKDVMDPADYRTLAALKAANRKKRRELRFAQLPWYSRLWRAVKSVLNELRGRG